MIRKQFSNQNFNFNRNGFTLIELVVTVAIVGVLASISMPVLQLSVQRIKENELHENLHMIRTAIDAYKKDVDEGHIAKSINQTGYPPSLEILVHGVEDIKDPKKHKLRYLRRIPLDPMQPAVDKGNIANNELINNWGLRSYASEAEHPAEGEDVYDVYSLSKQVGINGVPYAQW
jgi:general secretion pathway protein G